MMINCWFDGCCEPRNPGGHAAWGAYIELPAKPIEMSGYCGVGPKMSNNVAEYSGCIAVLNKLIELQGQGRIEPTDQVTIYSDSRLVVEQMTGNWNTTPGKLYYPYYQLAAKGLKYFGLGRVKFVWIPRDQNDKCDHLSKQVLKNMQVKFRIQPNELP